MTEKEQSLFDSYSMLFRKVNDVWDKFNVEEQEVEVGDKFDHINHRKVSEREPTGEEVPGTIVEVLKTGWLCEGKVLVPTEVSIVAFPKDKDEAEEAGDEEEGEEEEEEAEQGEKEE